MKRRVLTSVLLFAAMLTAGAVNVRIGTYNLRVQNADKNTPDSWEFRRTRCKRSILENRFDIFGVQEVSEFAQTQIEEDLEKNYVCVFFSPYSADGKGDKASGIIYRRDRFELVDYHFFWLSDNPDTVSDNDHYVRKVKSLSFKRGGSCAVFRDRRSGKMLFFMNHHGILNKEENLEYAHVLVKMEKRYNPDGLPSFLVGDFNARVGHPSHKLYRNWWSDAATGERRCTFTAFETNQAEWDSERHLDYVYYRNVAAPVRYVVNQKLYDGRCASDHFPVYADFRL